MIRALIVDDENPARREMKRLLAAHADIELAGEFTSAAECAGQANALKPHVIFLDIQMPGESGLEAAARLAECGARIVFVTAYHQHALHAFELAAFDYLLKPVESERLAITLDRIRGGLPPEEVVEKPWKEDDRIFLKNSERSWFTPLADIRLLESEGNHTRVLFGDHRPLVGRSLNAFEKRLPATLFFRANRAQIVNLKWIVSTEEWFSGSLKATLEDGSAVEFSRRQSKLFRETFGM